MYQELVNVYILYSAKLSRYYVGMTEAKPEERLRKHLSNHKGFTAKAKDWEIVKELAYISKQEALQREKQIKKRGIRRWLNENT